ncbi:MAG TPA: outer membrane protein transport protein [Casimicrobiaceae bacterium]|nr:outer membrane protein transport protein [Casimicrobiaceae bacterium]
MRFKFRRTRLTAALVGSAAALAGPLATGAGFALQENSASGLGNAYAGGAAVAEDASAVWFNPAGMARIANREVLQAAHIIVPSNKFTDNGSTLPFGQTVLGGNGGDAGGFNFVPNLYVVVPYNQQLTLGLGINVPFGLTTEYNNDFVGRFHGIRSEVKTINVQPSLSWRVNNQLSLGLGINWQRVDADLTSQANYSAAIAQGAQQAAAAGQIPASLVPTILGATRGLESFVRVKGDDNAWGWNIGALYEMTPDTRFGVHYRSRIKYKVRGDVDFDNPALPTLPATLAPVVNTIANGVNRALFDGDVRAEVELPEIVNVSFFHRLNNRWDIMGDIQYTGWSSFKDLTFIRAEGTLLATTPENFDDVWRFSLGANYRLDDRWMLRGGIAFDQSPVNDVDRTPRLPDSDRTWLSFGAQYKFSSHLVLDAGFTYIFVKDASIDTTNGDAARFGRLRGNYESNVVIVSAQAVYRF